MPIVADPPLVTAGSGASDHWLPGSGRAVPTSLLHTQYEYNGLRINNRSDLDCYFVKKISGLYDADITQTTEDNPDRHGQTLYGGLYRSRPLVITGYIRAGSYGKMEDMAGALGEAFDVIDRELPFIGRLGDIDHEWQIWCSKSGSMAIDDEQTTMDFRRDFMVTLKATDPFIYGVRERSASQNLNIGNTIICTNLGNREVTKWRTLLYGAQSNVTIVQNTTGQSFKLTGTIPAGRIYTIDWLEGTIEDDLGNNVFNQYDHTTDWLYLARSSDNVLTVTSTGKDANAAITSYWSDTYK